MTVSISFVWSRLNSVKWICVALLNSIDCTNTHQTARLRFLASFCNLATCNR